MLQVGYETFYPDEWCWFKTDDGEWIEVRLEMRIEYGEFYDCEVHPVSRDYRVQLFCDSFRLSQRLSKYNPDND